MARTNKTAGEETQTAKKKLPLLLRILLALLALAFVLGAVVACLGLDLLGRISRPAEDGFAAAGTPEPEEEYAPDQTPSACLPVSFTGPGSAKMKPSQRYSTPSCLLRPAMQSFAALISSAVIWTVMPPSASMTSTNI